MLNDILKHYSSLRLKHRFLPLNYERCFELPWVWSVLKSVSKNDVSYLDIGSGGESPLPTYVSKHKNWNVSVIDKFSWVLAQEDFYKKLPFPKAKTFKVEVVDLFDFKKDNNESYDVITCISVIEHFEGGSDSDAIEIIYDLLKPGGLLILTTPLNEGYHKEFYVKKDVYGDVYAEKSVYYQRHYSVKSFEERIISRRRWEEIERIYFGDYGFRAFENLFARMPKAIRVFYRFFMPSLAKLFISSNTYPISKENMSMNTESGIAVVLRKPNNT